MWNCSTGKSQIKTHILSSKQVCACGDTPKGSLSLAPHLSAAHPAQQARRKVASYQPQARASTLAKEKQTTGTNFPSQILIQDIFSLQITDPEGAKASLQWICASNNEVWAATVAPLCHTRADPWRDFLVVMLLIQQSLPQSPGSVALYYNTHTCARVQWVWLNEVARWSSLTRSQLNWNEALRNDLITWFTATSLLGKDNTFSFDFCRQFLHLELFFFSPLLQVTVKSDNHNNRSIFSGTISRLKCVNSW